MTYEITANIVSAYLAHNTIDAEKLPDLIKSVHKALQEPIVPEVKEEELVPAVNPKKSVFPDYIICLEDGKKLKMLKRHLKSAYDMTPQEYREKWGLPPEYPIVAPSYSEKRSSLAREIGLGNAIKNIKEPNVTQIPEVKRGRKPSKA